MDLANLFRTIIFQANYSNHQFPDHKDHTKWLFLFFNFGSIVARLTAGTVSDYRWAPRRVRILQLGLLVLGLSIGFTPAAPNFWTYVFCTFCVGLGDGSFACMFNPVAVDILGPAKAQQGLALLMAILSVPFAISGPLAGKSALNITLFTTSTIGRINVGYS